MSDIKITIFDNGPMQVDHASAATFCGEALDLDETFYLCRCGGSSNPPFCDGTHNKNGFDGTFADPDEQEVRVWEGRRVRTRFNTNACIHVLYCKPLKELRAAELAGDDSAAEEIMKVVQTCPSGALNFEIKDEALDPPAPPEHPAPIEIIEGGEVRMHAPFEVNADLRDGVPADRATLCRCGRSKNKPWCDGRHKGRKDFR